MSLEFGCVSFSLSLNGVETVFAVIFFSFWPNKISTGGIELSGALISSELYPENWAGNLSRIALLASSEVFWSSTA